MIRSAYRPVEGPPTVRLAMPVSAPTKPGESCGTGEAQVRKKKPDEASVWLNKNDNGKENHYSGKDHGPDQQLSGGRILNYLCLGARAVCQAEKVGNPPPGRNVLVPTHIHRIANML